MAGSVVTLIVGAVCIVLGVSHMRGNISTLHSYHRHRVAEEDVLPFGKKVGLGTIIMGVSIAAFAVLSAITFYTENDLFISIGTGLMIAGFVVGMGITFRAMIKYNKGIF